MKVLNIAEIVLVVFILVILEHVLKINPVYFLAGYIIAKTQGFENTK